MKIFLSWSGNKSQLVAELLNEWLRCTLQFTQPWLSNESIDRGALWFSEIANQLADTSVGILCITNENKDSPWILFEAGAIAKGLNNTRVCTFLIDLNPEDISGPLAQFNHTLCNKASIKKLIDTINRLYDNPLSPDILDNVFETYWESFNINLTAILQDESHPKTNKRSHDEILTEVLNTIRSLDRRMIGMEESFTSVSNSTFNSNRGEMKSLVERMLKAGKDTDDVIDHIRHYWQCTQVQATDLVFDVKNEIEKIKATSHANPEGHPLSSDMLKELKLKFGK